MFKSFIKIGFLWFFFFGLSVFLWSFLFPHDGLHARRFRKIYPAALDLWTIGYEVADSLYEEKEAGRILSDRQECLEYVREKVFESATNWNNKRPFGVFLREHNFLLYTPIESPIEETGGKTIFFLAVAFELPGESVDSKRKDENPKL